jgi:hypothetical protein
MRTKQPTVRGVPSLNRMSRQRRSSTDLFLFNRRAGLPLAILTGVLALVTGCTSTGTAIGSGQASRATAVQTDPDLPDVRWYQPPQNATHNELTESDN